MIEFKIGDRVKIKKNYRSNCKYAVIEKIEPSNLSNYPYIYVREIDNSCGFYFHYMLKLVK